MAHPSRPTSSPPQSVVDDALAAERQVVLDALAQVRAALAAYTVGKPIDVTLPAATLAVLFDRAIIGTQKPGQALAPFLAEEPVFPIRARDNKAVTVLHDLDLLGYYKMPREVIDRFRAWRKAHPQWCKDPD
jgi:hypothetical protein